MAILLLSGTEFLSTLPVRGATVGVVSALRGVDISIHAPREGSDSTAILPPVMAANFYPRSP